MTELPHPDNFHLRAAEGWMLLGDTISALEEIVKLRPASREKPAALRLEWQILAIMGDWTKAYAAADQLLAKCPDLADAWVHRAYAARRMKGGGLDRAWESLHPAAEKFPSESIIPYNLACYAAQMSRLDEAWTWLERAARASKDKRAIWLMAMADSDLEPIRERIAEEAR